MLSAKLNKAWRLFGTAFSFAFFGVGGLLLSLLILPINLVVRQPQRRIFITRFLIQHILKFFIFLMTSLKVLRVTINLPKLDTQRGLLITPNHPSLIDVVLLLSHFDQVNCVVKSSLWRNPFIGLVIRSAGYISNAAGKEVIALCRHSFEAGQSVIVFPEGTRTEPNQAIELQRGAANIALRAETDMLLIHIHVSPSTLTKAEPWYQIPSQQPRFQVSLGQLVRVKEVTKDCANICIAARVLTRYLTQALNNPATTNCTKDAP